ncbi:anti-sigma factor, partial [Nonomuraea terrae]
RRSLAEGEAALLGEEERGPRRRRRQRRGRVPAGVAAVAVAAAVALGVLALDARRDLGDLTARNAELAAVLAAPDAETVRHPATSGGTGTVVISRAMGRMVFASSGLPELPVGRTYELWLMGPDGPRPGGLLGEGGAEDETTTPVVLPAGPGDGHVALTVEPAGGSDSPTTPPVLLAALPDA